MMEMRADPRTGGELASAELGASHAVDMAIPRTKIAVGEHTVGKFAAQLQQARTVCRLRQWRARPDRLPARHEYRCEAIELGPKGALATCRKIKLGGDRCGDAELGWASVLGNVQVPCERAADRRIVPNSQPVQVAHEPALLDSIYSLASAASMWPHLTDCVLQPPRTVADPSSAAKQSSPVGGSL